MSIRYNTKDMIEEAIINGCKTMKDFARYAKAIKQAANHSKQFKKYLESLELLEENQKSKENK
ncbi:MAG: hypothetical protein GXO02_04280 [Epsilonproteobacteria bacterium]|nr:hypothetical protein [Campylobacterota bacterium]